MGDLSPNFSASEFICRHCGEATIDSRLIDGLQKVSDLTLARYGKRLPVRILSAYRCSEHNQAIGGEKASQHILGRAADIIIVGLSLEEMLEIVLQVPEFKGGGVGIYDDRPGVSTDEFIHVDVRPKPARWARIRGKYVSIQEGLKFIQGDQNV